MKRTASCNEFRFCPVHRQQRLWDLYGEWGFRYGVEADLKFANPAEDWPAALQKLLDINIPEFPNAKRLH